ncbi:putative late blight resistance protein homolog R1B-16 [Chenopodium quinoa]|nr:putative late blight resistance protein homolog R1B-16 [Chenopodium quinoa]
MICNDGRIKEHFGDPKWMSFPQELPLEEWLFRNLKSTGSTSNQIDCLSKDELKNRFWESLKGKRYLVVIDRVENDDELDGLMSLFPNESNGSRILITSRVPQADLYVQQRISFSYEVKPLDENQSWQLLSRKVLEGETHSDLEDLGKKLAEKCKGSPRKIVALARILNDAEKTAEMWSKIEEGYADISNYYDLLKDCKDLKLLYFGLFPEDVSISAKQMNQMWMEEGLLKKKGSKEAEEIGEEYLKKLIDQSVIQIDTRRADESVKTFRASSHISHFLITDGAAAEFFEVHMNNNLKPNTDIRRKVIHSESVTDVLKTFGNCSAKSLHCFGKNSHDTPICSERFWETLLNNFPQLRVLNLGFLELNKVPKELGKLKHLRYLRLRVPNAKHLPSFIVNLQQLETLDMRESCCPIKLPHGIWKMQFLRHLYLGAFTYLPKTSGSALSNLQTISGVYSDKNLKWLMVRAKFPNVRKLRICSFDSDLTCNFLNSLDHLYHLQSLRVEKSTKLPPDQNAFPLSLTKLTLLETKLQTECFKTLEKLPNLRILKLLENAIIGEEIACSDGGFLQLEVLYVEKVIVKNWRMSKEGMQCLKCLFIKECNGDILATDPANLKAKLIKENGTA